MADSGTGFIPPTGPIKFSDINMTRTKNKLQTPGRCVDGDDPNSSAADSLNFYENPAGFAFFPNRNSLCGNTVAFSEFRNANVLTISCLQGFPETTSKYSNSDNAYMRVDLDLCTITTDSGGNQCVDVIVNKGSGNIAAGTINPAAFTDGIFCIGKSKNINLTFQGNTQASLSIRNTQCLNTVKQLSVSFGQNDSGTATSTFTCVQTHANLT